MLLPSEEKSSYVIERKMKTIKPVPNIHVQCFYLSFYLRIWELRKVTKKL